MDLEETKNGHYPKMMHGNIDVLQELDDRLQYPAARCALEPAAFMYQ